MTDVDDVKATQETLARLMEQARTVLVAQDDVFEMLCVALVAQGHVLLEGVPGTAKTLMAKLLSHLINASFRRIQFTADLMPSDIVGTSVFDLESGKFFIKRGPVFTQVLLADEINRAPAKTQSALLEAMEEGQVTIEGERQGLDFPFFVVATQNPIEYQGTYPLPEAQLDRFLFKLLVTYPGIDAERTLLENYGRGFNAHDLDSMGLVPLLDPDGLRVMQRAAAAMTVEESILTYITTIVEETRQSPDLLLGASPRASIALFLSARVLALFRGRGYVLPDDVKELAKPVLRHRVILKTEAEIEGVTPDAVIDRLLARVEVPR